MLYKQPKLLYVYQLLCLYSFTYSLLYFSFIYNLISEYFQDEEETETILAMPAVPGSQPLVMEESMLAGIPNHNTALAEAT